MVDRVGVIHQKRLLNKITLEDTRKAHTDYELVMTEIK